MDFLRELNEAKCLAGFQRMVMHPSLVMQNSSFWGSDEVVVPLLCNS